MLRSLTAIIIAITTTLGGSAAAQDQIPATRTIYERGVDLVGTDLAQIFDTTAAACEAACVNSKFCAAFTFIQRTNACIPKTIKSIPKYIPIIPNTVEKVEELILKISPNVPMLSNIAAKL